VIDRNEALERVGGDEELLKEIALLFLAEYPKDMAAMRRAIDAGSAKDLERSAHSLKGAVANFGAHHTRDAALRLELIGRNGDLAEAEAGYQALSESLSNLRPFLQAIAE
jgi:HPt (histidine-containing phosphotransfer) domain-containing protein